MWCTRLNYYYIKVWCTPLNYYYIAYQTDLLVILHTKKLLWQHLLQVPKEKCNLTIQEYLVKILWGGCRQHTLLCGFTPCIGMSASIWYWDSIFRVKLPAPHFSIIMIGLPLTWYWVIMDKNFLESHHANPNLGYYSV